MLPLITIYVQTLGTFRCCRYWKDVLVKRMLPLELVSQMIELVGGKKAAKKLNEEAEKQRWVAAAEYDRESRRREYENKRVIGRQKFEAIYISAAGRAGSRVRYASSTEIHTRGCHWFPRLLA
jgi:hypothetical protein